MGDRSKGKGKRTQPVNRMTIYSGNRILGEFDSEGPDKVKELVQILTKALKSRDVHGVQIAMGLAKQSRIRFNGDLDRQLKWWVHGFQNEEFDVVECVSNFEDIVNPDSTSISSLFDCCVIGRPVVGISARNRWIPKEDMVFLIVEDDVV